MANAQSIADAVEQCIWEDVTEKNTWSLEVLLKKLNQNGLEVGGGYAKHVAKRTVEGILKDPSIGEEELQEAARLLKEMAEEKDVKKQERRERTKGPTYNTYYGPHYDQCSVSSPQHHNTFNGVPSELQDPLAYSSKAAAGVLKKSHREEDARFEQPQETPFWTPASHRSHDPFALDRNAISHQGAAKPPQLTGRSVLRERVLNFEVDFARVESKQHSCVPNPAPQMVPSPHPVKFQEVNWRREHQLPPRLMKEQQQEQQQEHRKGDDRQGFSGGTILGEGRVDKNKHANDKDSGATGVQQGGPLAGTGGSLESQGFEEKEKKLKQARKFEIESPGLPDRVWFSSGALRLSREAGDKRRRTDVGKEFRLGLQDCLAKGGIYGDLENVDELLAAIKDVLENTSLQSCPRNSQEETTRESSTSSSRSSVRAKHVGEKSAAPKTAALAAEDGGSFAEAEENGGSEVEEKLRKKTEESVVGKSTSCADVKPSVEHSDDALKERVLPQRVASLLDEPLLTKVEPGRNEMAGPAALEGSEEAAKAVEEDGPEGKQIDNRSVRSLWAAFPGGASTYCDNPLYATATFPAAGGLFSTGSAADLPFARTASVTVGQGERAMRSWEKVDAAWPQPPSEKPVTSNEAPSRIPNARAVLDHVSKGGPPFPKLERPVPQNAASYEPLNSTVSETWLSTAAESSGNRFQPPPPTQVSSYPLPSLLKQPTQRAGKGLKPGAFRTGISNPGNCNQPGDAPVSIDVDESFQKPYVLFSLQGPYEGQPKTGIGRSWTSQLTGDAHKPALLGGGVKGARTKLTGIFQAGAEVGEEPPTLQQDKDLRARRFLSRSALQDVPTGDRALQSARLETEPKPSDDIKATRTEKQTVGNPVTAEGQDPLCNTMQKVRLEDGNEGPENTGAPDPSEERSKHLLDWGEGAGLLDEDDASWAGGRN